MRAPVILCCFALLAVAACDKAPDRDGRAATAARAGLTIKTDRAAPQATVPPLKGGKLAVLPKESAPAQAPAPAASPSPDVQPTRVAVQDEADYAEPRFGRDWRGDAPPLGPGDCRRAERRGDPMADGPECRDLLYQGRSLEDECMEADAEGDDFAFSRQCRRILGGY